MAKRFLTEKGYSFEEIDIEENNISREEMASISKGLTVPQIIINDLPIFASLGDRPTGASISRCPKSLKLLCSLIKSIIEPVVISVSYTHLTLPTKA